MHSCRYVTSFSEPFKFSQHVPIRLESTPADSLLLEYLFTFLSVGSVLLICSLLFKGFRNINEMLKYAHNILSHF